MHTDPALPQVIHPIECSCFLKRKERSDSVVLLRLTPLNRDD